MKRERFCVTKPQCASYGAHRITHRQCTDLRISMLANAVTVYSVWCATLELFGSHYVVLSRSFSCVSFGWMGGVDQPKPDQNQNTQGS